jgi:hypothetical protein
MRFYIQYLETGIITAGVSADAAPPHPRQLVFDEIVEYDGMMVDVNSSPPGLIKLPEVEPSKDSDDDKT